MYNEVMGYISRTNLFGVIPLDLTLHFFIGMLWTIIGLKKEFSLKWISIGLITIALGKELNDYFFHYRVGWQEYASDFGITLLYLVLVVFVRKIKKKLDRPKVQKWKVH